MNDTRLVTALNKRFNISGNARVAESPFGSIDLDKAEIIEYTDNTSNVIQAITIKISETDNYVIPVLNGELLSDSYLANIQKLEDNVYKYKLLQIDSKESFECTIVNGKVKDPNYKAENSSNKRGEGSCFGRCTATYFERFTDGSTEGALAGIGCTIFGLACGISILGNCWWYCQ